MDPELKEKIGHEVEANGYHIGKHSLTLKLPGVAPKSFDHSWLREGCKCPRCVDPSTKQRDFDMARIPFDIAPDSVKWDGTNLEIYWKGDIPGYENHMTTYNVEYLLDSNLQYPINTGRRRWRFLWGRGLMQKFQHWTSYEDYMNDEVKFTAAMAHLSSMGMIFLKDIPQSREMVEKIATRMGPLRNTFYGSTWDVRSIPDPKNVAYTDKPLGFHMDLMYMSEPPGFQLLHCLENSCEGGESLFSDAFAAATSLRRNGTEHHKWLKSLQLRYKYDNDDAVYFNSWPVLEYDKHSNHLLNVNYSPPFQAHTQPPSLQPEGKSHQYKVKSLEYFANALENKRAVFELKLEPGQCVIFENRRVVHSRRQFNSSSGNRWLAGAYVDSDDLISQFRMCGRKHPQTWATAFKERFDEYHKNSPTDPESK